MLTLTKILEKGVGLTEDEAWVGQRIQLDNDIGEVDWLLISVYTTLVGYHSLLEEFISGRETNLQDN